MKDIKLVELFSGIGGFTKGLQDAGFNITKHYYSEIDKYAIANYKYNYPNAEYIGSVTDVRGKDLGRPDIITFGSPCQDFSLAGKQTGLKGDRSVLILEAIRLLRECQPSVFIWENVKGTFSSNNGADFWAILNAFANIGGYRLEWQLLNTSWFLPQNRERIYLVGHLAGKSKPGVFPIGESCGITNSKIKVIANTNKGGERGAVYGVDGIMSCLTSTDYKQPKQIAVQPVLTPGRQEKRQNGRRFKKDGEPSFTLSCQDRHGVMIRQIPRGNNKGNDFNVCPTISANSFEHNNHLIQKPETTGNPQGTRVYKTNGIASTINSGGGGLGGKTGLYELDNLQIRRLTEIECERLQGFPDDWTRYGNYDGEIKEISKTQRYKMCGNAVTTKVVKAIGERIQLSNLKKKNKAV